MFSPGVLQTLYFAQGHTPQSLKLSLTSGVQNDADELSRILEEASDVVDIEPPSEDSESQVVELKTVCNSCPRTSVNLTGVLGGR